MSDWLSRLTHDLIELRPKLLHSQCLVRCEKRSHIRRQRDHALRLYHCLFGLPIAFGLQVLESLAHMIALAPVWLASHAPKASEVPFDALGEASQGASLGIGGCRHPEKIANIEPEPKPYLNCSRSMIHRPMSGRSGGLLTITPAGMRADDDALEAGQFDQFMRKEFRT